MISTGFGYGEREGIASAYAKMYAPKRTVSESCCGGKSGCCSTKSKKSGGLTTKHCVPKKTGSKLGVRKVLPFEKRDAKPSASKFSPKAKKVDGVTKKVEGKLQTKHVEPKKTGSKLGVRKVLPFEKRDSKPSAAKFTPKVKKVVESTRHFCIADGDRTLCTNDIGESYFSKAGITGETRIYESRIAAMKDIKKVKARRNPNSKYRVRACEKVGESVQFVGVGGQPVNEGLWDGITNIAKGAGNLVGGTLKGAGNLVGGVAKGAGNVLQGNFSQAGKDLVGGVTGAGSDVWNGVTNAGTNLKNAAGDVVDTVANVANTAGNVTKAVGNTLTGDIDTAGENLKAAGSSAFGAVADKGAEADVAGAASKALDATKTAAGKAWGATKAGASAVGNVAAAPLKAAGGVVKGAGELMQGNVADAKNAVTQGVAAAGDNLVAAKNAVTPAQKAAAPQQPQTQPQQQPQQQSQQTAAVPQKPNNAATSGRSSVTTIQGDANATTTPSNSGAAAEIARYEQQIADLQKKLASLRQQA